MSPRTTAAESLPARQLRSHLRPASRDTRDQQPMDLDKRHQRGDKENISTNIPVQPTITTTAAISATEAASISSKTTLVSTSSTTLNYANTNDPMHNNDDNGDDDYDDDLLFAQDSKRFSRRSDTDSSLTRLSLREHMGTIPMPMLPPASTIRQKLKAALLSSDLEFYQNQQLNSVASENVPDTVAPREDQDHGHENEEEVVVMEEKQSEFDSEPEQNVNEYVVEEHDGYQEECEEECTDHILVWSPPKQDVFDRHFSPPLPLMFDLLGSDDEHHQDNDKAHQDTDHPVTSPSKLSLESLKLNNTPQDDKVILEDGNHAGPSTLPRNKMDEMDAQDDDDPFGFTKIERRLQRTRSARPKPLAINEQRQIRTSSSSILSSRPVIGNRTESSASSLSSRLGLGVSRRSSIRKRGDIRNNRAKAVEFSGNMQKSSTGHSNSLTSDGFKDVSDFDRFMDLDQSSSHSRASTSKPEKTSSISAQDKGKGKAIDKDDIMDVDMDVDMDDVTNVPDSPASSGNTTPPPKQQRSWPRSHRYSMGLDLPPITLESTPTKNPEAGMPASLMKATPAPDCHRSGRGQKSRGQAKSKTTEKLEALLPKRKSLRLPSTSTSITTAAASRQTRKTSPVEVNESDIEVSSSESELENNRRRLRSGTTTTAGAVLPKRSQKGAVVAAKKTTIGYTRISRPTTTTTDLTTGSSVGTHQSARSKGTKDKAKEQQQQVHVHQRQRDSGWSAEQRKVREERIRYFKEVDDFELEVETTR
ncbi:hypothetical protein BG004_007631 [Podila humilis]|nr:hypothetical protein BG004_007631 [Podila humilis]